VRRFVTVPIEADRADPARRCESFVGSALLDAEESRRKAYASLYVVETTCGSGSDAFEKAQERRDACVAEAGRIARGRK
jgi:hypothetical protein